MSAVFGAMATFLDSPIRIPKHEEHESMFRVGRRRFDPDDIRSEEGDEGNEEGSAGLAKHEVVHREQGGTMTQQTKKMSEILKEMSERLLRYPDAAHSSEAAHVALMFANFAWNESVGLGHPRESYRSAWELIEAENPEMWSEFKSTDVDGMIDELVRFKQQHFSDDLRRILTCGIPNGSIRVEWLPPAAPGVDSKSEMRVYGLIRTGQREQAIEFLRETRGLSRTEATKLVKKIASDLGLE